MLLSFKVSFKALNSTLFRVNTIITSKWSLKSLENNNNHSNLSREVTAATRKTGNPGRAKMIPKLNTYYKNSTRILSGQRIWSRVSHPLLACLSPRCISGTGISGKSLRKVAIMTSICRLLTWTSNQGISLGCTPNSLGNLGRGKHIQIRAKI